MKKSIPIFLVLIVISCTAKNNLEADLSVSYLALGDSYTIGESVDSTMRYPEIIRSKLIDKNAQISDLKIIAKTGWTTDELQDAMNKEGIQNENYDIVSLLIGVNNQYRGRDVDSYITEFEQLLMQAISIANGNKSKVFVISIPDYAFTPYGNGNADITSGVAEYNKINQDIADNFDVRYFNITEISENGLENTQLVAKDGLHPSGLQYKMWVDTMIEGIVELINDNN